ncbi:MAG: hypothetical protein ACI9L9_000487 [Marivirga sp.]|jgi:hypothetical protein
MSSRIPESFFIYQQLVSKLAYEKAKLQLQYEARIDTLSSEIGNLLHTIQSQNGKLKESEDYIHVLEEKLNTYKKAS